MAVLTETSRIDIRAGDANIVIGTLTGYSSTDTWDPGLRQIFLVTITPTTAPGTVDTGSTTSGGRITLLHSGGGTLTSRVMAIGV